MRRFIFGNQLIGEGAKVLLDGGGFFAEELQHQNAKAIISGCLLYTSDAADE